MSDGDTPDAKEIKIKELAAKLSAPALVDRYKIAIANKIASGETGLASELKRLAELEDMLFNNADPNHVSDEAERALLEITSGIPECNKVKRPYTLTPAAREARKANAQQSTGPRTEEGKKRSAANGNNANWKHGHCSKSIIKKVLGVCTTNCDKYPCQAVKDKETRAGELCLDREGYLQKVNTLIKAAHTGSIQDVKELNAVLLANGQEILERMMSAVFEDGTMLLENMVDKKGRVVAHKFKNHPHIVPILDYMYKLGVTFTDAAMTEKEKQKTKDADKDRDTIARALGESARLFTQAMGHEPKNG